MSEGSKRIVVVGAGIGGVGVAALLQHKGHHVILLERNDFTGGRCTSFMQDGFIVDSAFHMFSFGDSGPHGEINRRVRGDLQWKVYGTMGTAYMNGRGFVKIPVSIPGWIPQGASAYVRGALRPKIFKNLRHVLRNFGITELIQTLYKILMVDEQFMQSLNDITMYDFLSRISEDPVIHRPWAFLSLLATVVPYTEVSAGELLWSTLSSYRRKSLGVPIGGSKEIPASFIRAFKRDGGEMRLRCGVSRILVENGKVRGVETREGEEINADVVISNAGIQRTVELAGEENFPEEYTSYIKGLRYSYGAVIVKLGLNRKVEGLPPRGFFNMSSLDPEKMVDYIERRYVPDDLPFATIIPSDWDANAAPLGKQLVILGTMVPNEVTPENIEFGERIMDRLESMFYHFFPQVRDNVEWRIKNNVAHFASMAGRERGEVIGLAQCVGQTGVYKPSPLTPVKDLWMVGCDAGARGVGTEQASASALYVSNLI